MKENAIKKKEETSVTEGRQKDTKVRKKKEREN
jgi:hypothetical protein